MSSMPLSHTSRAVVERYIDDVISRRIDAPQTVVDAVRRFIALQQVYSCEWTRVEVVRRFINNLRHIRGRYAGKPFELLPWQLFVLAHTFGLVQDDGRRVTRRVFISVPRKNGKSTLAAALALSLLLCDGEPGPQVMCVASSRSQARITVTEAMLMLRESRFADTCYLYRNELRTRDGLGVLWAASADAGTLHGYHLHGAVIDELHAHKTRGVWDAVMTSMGAREQPLMIITSTAGVDPSGLFEELREHAGRVHDGSAVDDGLFAFDCYAPAELDWRDEHTWRLANPSLEHSVTVEGLRDIARQAIGPSGEAAFRRYHLNQTITHSGEWLPDSVWRSCTVEQLPPLDGCPCVLGLDASSTVDMTALVAAYALPDGAVAVVPYCWASEYAATRTQRAHIYSQYATEGELVITPGDVIDYGAVELQIRRLVEQHRVRCIYYDRAFSGELVRNLISRGVPETLLVDHPQHARAMDGPISRTERLIMSGKLIRRPSRLLDDAVRNVIIELNAYGQRRLSKKRALGPIDVVVAMVMAVGNLHNVHHDGVAVQWV